MMKKLFFLVFTVMMSGACDTYEIPSRPSDNKMEFDGDTYVLVYGEMVYMGQESPENLAQGTSAINIVISDDGDGNGVAFKINVPDTQTTPVPGVYALSDSHKELTFSKAQFIRNFGQYIGDYEDVTSGSLQIAFEDGIYAIKFNCMIGVKTFVGTYVEELEWFDRSEE